MRHTMGNDWGGRRKENPENVPRVTAKMVEDYAASIHVEIRRDGIRGMWFYVGGFKLESACWYTLGSTNYLALENLRKLQKEKGNGRSKYQRDKLTHK